jgi:hypothetical protein
MLRNGLFYSTYGRDIPGPTPDFPTNGLTSYWRFDTLSDSKTYDQVQNYVGTAEDDSIFGHDTIRNKGVRLPQEQFDGARAVVTDATIPYAYTFSIALWLRKGPEYTGTTDGLIHISDYEELYRGFWIALAGNNIELNMGGGSGASSPNRRTGFYNGVLPADQNWHHVVVNIKAFNNYDLYVDAVPRTRSSSSGTLGSVNWGTTPYISFFRIPVWANRTADLYLDEVATWDRGLTPEEAEELYNNGNGLFY